MVRPIGAGTQRKSRTPEQAFGKALTDLRVKRGVSQEELAELHRPNRARFKESNAADCVQRCGCIRNLSRVPSCADRTEPEEKNSVISSLERIWVTESRGARLLPGLSTLAMLASGFLEQCDVP